MAGSLNTTIVESDFKAFISIINIIALFSFTKKKKYIYTKTKKRTKRGQIVKTIKAEPHAKKEK